MGFILLNRLANIVPIEKPLGWQCPMPSLELVAGSGHASGRLIANGH